MKRLRRGEERYVGCGMSSWRLRSLCCLEHARAPAADHRSMVRRTTGMASEVVAATGRVPRPAEALACARTPPDLAEGPGGVLTTSADGYVTMTNAIILFLAPSGRNLTLGTVPAWPLSTQVRLSPTHLAIREADVQFHLTQAASRPSRSLARSTSFRESSVRSFALPLLQVG